MRNPRSRIGIVGAGHLGTSLARIFLSRGWSAEELLVAHRGSRASLEALEALNLADRSAPTPRVFESDVVFITVRPEDLAAFRGMEIPSRTILVSCLAGIPVATAQALLAHPVIRVLPSSPTSLEEGKGIAGVFPGNSGVETLVSSLGIVVHPLKDEEDFHSFTACLCLPAALMEWSRRGNAFSEDPQFGIRDHTLPGLADLLAWARSVTPVGLTAEEQRAYVTRMATPGGITEAMVQALDVPGADLAASFASGEARSRALASANPYNGLVAFQR